MSISAFGFGVVSKECWWSTGAVSRDSSNGIYFLDVFLNSLPALTWLEVRVSMWGGGDIWGF